MKIDLHTHGILATKLPFSWEYTKRQFNEASLAGLDAVCVTEHFKIPAAAELYKHIEDEFERFGDHFIYGGLKIFTGTEIDIREGGHITAVGTPEDTRALRVELEPYTKKDSYLPFKELLPLLNEYPLITGAAHPFRDGVHTAELPEELLSRLTYIELNGKDAAANREDIEKRTYALARRANLPVAAGSDTHQALMYGCIYNLMEDCDTAEQLRQIIANGQYKIRFAENCAFMVKAATQLKNAQKLICALGGDHTKIFTQPL